VPILAAPRPGAVVLARHPRPASHTRWPEQTYQRAAAARGGDSMLRILIADDHAIVRKGLKEILREAAQDTEVGEASNGQEALARVEAGAFDVVVLDITMPGQSGLEVLKQLKQQHPDLPVLMLCMHSGYHYVKGSLKAGASGYLTKETAPEELVTAIRTAIGGGIYVSRSLSEGLDLEH
jgi:DNA-binding NarL/FixJ family response regulator